MTVFIDSSGSFCSSVNASAHLMMFVSIFDGFMFLFSMGSQGCLFCEVWGFGCDASQYFAFLSLETLLAFTYRFFFLAVSVGV